MSSSVSGECACVSVKQKKEIYNEEVSDRFNYTTFTCYHLLVSGVITECSLGDQHPTVTGGHEESRELELGWKADWWVWGTERREWRRSSLCMCVWRRRSESAQRRVSSLSDRSETRERKRQGQSPCKIQSCEARSRRKGRLTRSWIHRGLILWVVWKG